MTTTEPQPTPADPDDWVPDDAGGDGIALGGKGWVRLALTDDNGSTAWVRMRPPFFGEYKSARLRMEQISETLAPFTDEAAAEADAMEAEAKADAEAAEAGALSEREKSDRRRARQRRDAEAARKVTREQERLWLEWWADTLQALVVPADRKAIVFLDGTEGQDRLPPYMASGGTAMRVLAHWRAGPLGRGLPQ